MILILSLAIIAVLVFFIALLRQSKAKRYEDPHFIDNLKHINAFFTEINTLQGYVTWVKREEIKSKYQSLWQFFPTRRLIILIRTRHQTMPLMFALGGYGDLHPPAAAFGAFPEGELVVELSKIYHVFG